MLKLRDLEVVYEDNHLIAVNKPNRVLVHGDETGDRTLADVVKQYIKEKYKKPGDVFLGVIHRLDRPVSGVTVFARTSKALTRMNKLFQEKKIQKVYWALTTERPEPIEGKLEHYLLKDKHRNISKAYTQLGRRTKDAKLSELSYKMIAALQGHFLLEVKPKTGRPHQIRVQLSEMGTPIRGDIKYGFKFGSPGYSISLHCRSMTFEHPVKKEEITVSSDPPSDQYWNHFHEYYS